MSVSVIIKALNEERHIAAAIESALAALGRAGVAAGEVILADSGSGDRTVEIAARYPVRIARLADPAERSCGLGPQLGYQYARGDTVCLMDGDMVLAPEFLAEGLAFLESHPRVAGVAGAVHDVNVLNLEFRRRRERGARDLAPGPVDRLNGGGLYRRAAIEEAGVFSDRNLHGYEEFDLAVRLRTAGWTLHRLPVPFVDHHGHTIGGYRLLWRRYRSRYLFGIGELLRGAVGRPHFARTLADLPEIRLWLGVYAGWLVALALMASLPFATALLALLGLVILPTAALSLRYRSVALGTYAFVAWNAHALGMALGFLRARKPPEAWIASEIVEPGRRGGDPSEAPVRSRSAVGGVAAGLLLALSAATAWQVGEAPAGDGSTAGVSQEMAHHV